MLRLIKYKTINIRTLSFIRCSLCKTTDECKKLTGCKFKDEDDCGDIGVGIDGSGDIGVGIKSPIPFINMINIDFSLDEFDD